MAIEINEIRLLLPAIVTFTQDGEKKSIFVYLDQANRDVVIPDETIVDVNELKSELVKFYKNRSIKTPELPKDIFKSFNPNEFKGM
jgi:hypothetical protein